MAAAEVERVWTWDPSWRLSIIKGDTQMGVMSGRPGVALIILDGWGHAEAGEGNAVSLASTPVFDSLLERYPWALLEASGEAVGLPPGVMGNSEVGHLTLGSGRVVNQDLSRINAAVEDGSFYSNPALSSALRTAKEEGSAVHLMGLLSDAGVHSAIGHIHALVRMARLEGGDRAEGPLQVMQASYESGTTDEFILPTIVDSDPDSRIRGGDTVIFFNFRPDRARQLTRALTHEKFRDFDRGANPPALRFVGMTEYDAALPVAVAFSDEPPVNMLTQVLSKAGLVQLHIAETEQYAHVTFFFNGGREEAYPGEIRKLIPSPSDVDTYDQKPAMSARGVVNGLREVMEEQDVDFVLLNFANPDMVGHTGDIDATIEALETVDVCLGDTLELLLGKNFHVLVTADHGNVECMINKEGSVNTAHTTNPVPLVYLRQGVGLREGTSLAYVASTVLELFGLELPVEMTGKTLF